MEQIYLLPDLQIKQAKERIERLQKEAIVYKLSSHFSWRKRMADALVRVAGWLEPTPNLSNFPISPALDDLSTNLSK